MEQPSDIEKIFDTICAEPHTVIFCSSATYRRFLRLAGFTEQQIEDRMRQLKELAEPPT